MPSISLSELPAKRLLNAGSGCGDTGGAVVTSREDIDALVIIEQKMVYTGFPFDYEFYVVDEVMMVMTEY